MSGVFVQLDAEYDSDDRLIEAGALAELLYVRGLAFCKRTLSDGHITRSQLTIVGRGIPSASKHAKRLVEVGAWTETDRGWLVAAWAKRNRSAADVERVRNARKAASAAANHERWHIGPEGRPALSCRLCYPQTDSQNGSQNGSVTDSTEPEAAAEAEPQTTDTSKPSSRSQQPEPPSDVFTNVIEAMVGQRLQSERNIRNPVRYAATLRRDLPAEHGPTILRLLEQFPDAPSSSVAAAVLTGDTRQLAGWAR